MANNTSTHVGFVSEPNAGRGTVGILWQCLTTISLCICTCLHLNVPPRPLSRSQAALRSFFWITIGILFPELMCYHALQEQAYAKALSRHLKAHNLGDLSTKQAHFLLWGGLRVQHADKLLKSHKLVEWICDNEYTDERSRNFVQFLLNHVPADATIDDRSKADTVAKVLSFSQALWVAVQVITRLQQHLDVSLLEVVSLVYIALALLAYTAWFSEPYGISISEHILLPSEFDFIKVQIGSKSYENSWITFDFAVDDLDIIQAPERRLIVSGVFLGIAFAGTHCAAWKYCFPTAIEKYLWRVSAILLVVVTLIYSGITGVSSEISHTHSKFAKSLDKLVVDGVSGWIWVGSYLFARMFLWVETFISFRSAPRGIYEAVNWTQYIGHVGS